MTIMATYDRLAPHYDAVTGDSSTEAALIRDILERRHGRVATLLDVACGTGAITAPLARAYQVSGLDIAPGMLAVARAKLPGDVPLYLADMTSFTLSTRFDAIVCAYQGVNHLLTLSAWQSFFGCAYRHLNPGGMLVFDIATVEYLMTMASIPQGRGAIRRQLPADNGEHDRRCPVQVAYRGIRTAARRKIRTAHAGRRDAIVPRRSG